VESYAHSAFNIVEVQAEPDASDSFSLLLRLVGWVVWQVGGWRMIMLISAFN